MERDFGREVERVAPVARPRPPPPVVDIDNLDAVVGAVEVAADCSPPPLCLNGYEQPEAPLQGFCVELDCAEDRERRQELEGEVVSCGVMVIVRLVSPSMNLPVVATTNRT